MPDWFIGLGQVTLTLMMIMFLASVAFSIAAVVYVFLDELIRRKNDK